ncbi:MAG: alpha/beta fold hydrolase [Gemmataceae bacterium]
MLVDLVSVTAPDGCVLHGALQRSDAPCSLALDAACLFHGTGSNFYGSSLLESVSQGLVDRGVPTVRGNTRGHDGISHSSFPRGGVRLGAAFETVDDCRHDLKGWFDFLKREFGPRILIGGHSLGAVKSLYAVAHESGLEPTAILAISPPMLSYEKFCSSDLRDDFLESFRRAEELVASGQGNTLLEVRIPLPMLISAAGYVEKYGPDERYAFLRFLRLVRTPTFFLYGGNEIRSNPAFTEVPQAIAERQTKQPNLGLHIIPEADHFYTGKRPAAWTAIDAWLGKQVPIANRFEEE